MSSDPVARFHRPSLLDTSRHHRDAFHCGEKQLDTWLRTYAGQNRRRNTAATWVITDDQEQVRSYATLSMTGLARAGAPKSLGSGSSDPVPALLIGRLATDQSCAGLGLAGALVQHVLATAVDLNSKAACRAVVVIALNPAAQRWWQRWGFVPLDERDPASLNLYLLVQDIAAALEL